MKGNNPGWLLGLGIAACLATAFLVAAPTTPTTNALFATSISSATSGSASAELNVNSYHEANLDVNVSAITGTSPQIQFFLDRYAEDGIWYQVWSGTAITTTGSQSTSFGMGGQANLSLGKIARVRWTIGGTTPHVTATINFHGK